ncbi:hypothetical protein CAC42_6728 [Sphaceloma murrayae]|uniref:Uncharacterized protein n=1 Tax=Sphaceloma murrayae TaxID=2082308 RepID=A0A2K1QGD2_9PEZI|nr:hypothetical protein CAC42_6728 [Sphaceloma murrayae]
MRFFQQHSVVSSPISSAHSTPQRLSNLYQYHNAPEVAPAAGLEYDDSIHPYSDKYPVVHSAHSSATTLRAKKSHESCDNKPPVIIFGMKMRTFCVVSFVVILVIIGAAVGGALGRPKAAQAMPIATTSPAIPNATLMPNITSASATPTSTLITSTFNAPIPTYSVLNDCPQSNNTLYTTKPISSVDNSPRYNYTKHCNLDSPLSQNGARTLSEAFVYSFNDCIQVCASLNFWQGSENCTAAVFMVDGLRPANCFVGMADVSQGTRVLGARGGVNVALMQVR